MLGSRAWRALMRRNAIYRKRNVIGSIFELLLPIGFIGILVAIKVSLEDSESFSPTLVPAYIPTDQDVATPLSFGDYLTAVQAERKCVAIAFGGNYLVTGQEYEGTNWMVPFVKCDSRACRGNGEDARSNYCEYNILAVAPETQDDEVGAAHVQKFKTYVESRYPEILSERVTSVYNTSKFGPTLMVEFTDDKAIEDYVKSSDYGKSGNPKIALGVVFSRGSSVKDYSYKLRMNSTNFNNPEGYARPAAKTMPATDQKLESYARDDTECEVDPDMGYKESSCAWQYMYNGALVIQRLVGDWIMEDSGAKDAGYFVSEHGVQFVSFPSKEYWEDGFYNAIKDAVTLLVIIGFLYPVAVMIRAVVSEKEQRQKELMKMMSVTESDIGWSWFLSFFFFHVITIIGTTATSAVLFSNSKLVYLVVFWIFTLLSTIVFCVAVASIMSKATRATVVGLLLFFVGYFLTVAVSVENGSSGLIALFSIHPAAAFSFGLQEIGRLEDLGVGVTSSTWNTTDSPSGYTFRRSINSMTLDCIVWGILSWYLNRVLPADFGTPLPWYFPFTRSYWCPGSAHAPTGSEDGGDDMASEQNILMEPVSDALKRQANEGKSIEIHRLMKQFGEKTAVEDLTLSMYSGQVTALLGHNGAGKTTTINMLTGMIAPTSGYATVAGKDIRTQMGQIRDDIGICLQHDCLFPMLTVKEHVQFFARVKGLYAKEGREEAEKKIMESIEDVALGEKRDTFSKNLSGGMKRKLSVAIAFCGGSKTVLLDEPTSGMDPFSRRFTWNVIRQYREDRCIILTTHFMDEADILGDRIAIMGEGRLRCVGSSLFLKKSYGVGYQLTIEKPSRSRNNNGANSAAPTANSSTPSELAEEEDAEYHTDEQDFDLGAESSNGKSDVSVDIGVPVVEGADGHLKNIVKSAVPKAHLLSNVGTELQFQLPLGASSEFQPMFESLDKEVERGTIITYGVSITTLDEVFLMVARGETGESEALPSSIRSGGAVQTDLDKSARSRMDLESEGLFTRHVSALFQKRALNFKRDKKAWCCSTILPVIFVFVGLIIYKFVPFETGDYEPLSLTLDDYNTDITASPRNPIPFNNPGVFSCHPGVCAQRLSSVNLNATEENYSYCGAGFLGGNNASCTIADSAEYINGVGGSGGEPIPADVSNIQNASTGLLTSAFAATKYGALYYTHEPASTTQDGSSYGQSIVAACQAIDRDYVNQSLCANYEGIGYVVGYNYTALHSAPLYQTLADEALIRQALDDDEFTITNVLDPLPVTSREDSVADATNSFLAWFLIVLSFPFIMATFGTFVVAERASNAKHLQTVAGVKPTAYWISTYLWDIMNYQLPLWITVILMFAFGISTFTTRDRGVLGGVLLLLILFGPAAAVWTYCVSFAFKSPSMCSLFIIIFNFILSMAGPIVMLVLRIIGSDPADPKDNLVNIAVALEWVLRFFPSFCLGKGLYNIINIQLFGWLTGEGDDISVWKSTIVLWEVVFLAGESIVYLLLAIKIDIWSSNPRAVARWNAFVGFVTFRCFCPSKSADEERIQASVPDDDDVLAEQQRVLNGQANDDLVVVDQLTKIYPNGKVAVNHVSFGIPPGQCFGLLGINGAGKTTVMGVLTAEFPPTSGDATLAGFSVTSQPEMTRRRIGYCPQFDAHFTNMTGREHVEMYASIKGVPAANVKEAAAAKLDELGLNEEDRERLSAGYSGGMKRKLSVACATIGQPQIVFLDEPSTGMDPVARRDLWKVISDMVEGGKMPDEERTSVILTTHSMEECEALCPRIAIMANGKLRCLGSAQHLKTRFGQGFQVELKLKDVDVNDEDYLINLAKLRVCGTGANADDADRAPSSAEEGRSSFVEGEAKFLRLPEALEALKSLTGDEYLSSMVSADSPTGYVVYKAASSVTGATLNELASFATEEIRMRSLQAFVELTYPNSILRERQEGKARYEVGSEGVRISNIFANIEENKERLMLSDYGVSQTTLEQVFNMHAAEAEKMKHQIGVDHERGALGAAELQSRGMGEEFTS